MQFGERTLTLFDSIFNLPSHRESKMNFYLLSDLGIGSSFAEVDAHLSAIQMQAYHGDTDSLSQEIENLKLNYFTMLSEYSPTHLAWLCLVAEIDGVPFTDLSEENLIKVGRELSETIDIDYKWRDIFDELKKKLPMRQVNSSQNGLEMIDL